MTQRNSEMSHQAATSAGWPRRSTFRQCLAERHAPYIPMVGMYLFLPQEGIPHRTFSDVRLVEILAFVPQEGHPGGQHESPGGCCGPAVAPASVSLTGCPTLTL